jgi:hypothetical protein
VVRYLDVIRSRLGRFEFIRNPAVQHKASDYRMMAALCLELANQVSLEQRAHLLDVAQKWLDLAQKSGEPFGDGNSGYGEPRLTGFSGCD